MSNRIEKLKEIISRPQKIVITTHRGPDGDAIGSSLALYNFLLKLGHTVNVITPNDYASFLHWLPGNNEVIEFEGSEKISEKLVNDAETIFMLDFNHLYRADGLADYIKKSNANKVLIDHHRDPEKNIADIVFSNPDICSTCQLLFEIIEQMGMFKLIDKNIAECIYVGIMTDTGSFKYSSTTSKTHNVIASLIDCGARNTKIHDLIYDNYSADRMKLLGYCLNNKMLLFPENNSAIISLSNKELKKFNFKKGDTEGIINYALAIKGIIFAAFIVERDNIVKLSLRSKGSFKVNEIAKKYFSGGGHENAAGGVSTKNIESTIGKVKEIINNYKNELNNIK